MRINTIKGKFINFLKQNNFNLIDNNSIISNNKDLLFINSGMARIKNLFLNKQTNNKNLLGSIQPCLRFIDLKTIGLPNDNHLTYFNMLGLFFIDLFEPFKMMNLVYNFLFKVIKIPIRHCYFSIFPGDEITKEYWLKLKINKEKIFNSKDNIWKYGNNGPCGFCTEIFFDINKNKNNKKELLEIANIVFITQIQQNDKIIDNDIKSIDVGIGLERCCMVLQKVTNIFKIHCLNQQIKIIQNNFKINDITDQKILINHINTLNILLNNNVFPSNKKRGFISKKILLIILKIIKKYNINIEYFIKFFFNKFNKEIIKIINNLTNKDNNNDILIAKILKNKEKINEKKLFFLYNTKGIKYQQIIELIKNNDIKINIDTLNELILNHKKQSTNKSNSIRINLDNEINNIEETKFIGYNFLESFSKLLFKKKYQNFLYLIFDKTPFYTEAGGQINDKGLINDKYPIIDAYKYNNKIIHIIDVKKLNINDSKEFKINSKILITIDKIYRLNITRNHTATHLLRFFIQKNISLDCIQRGSKITDKYLSFDFNYLNKINQKDIKKIEDDINNIIYQNHIIKTYIVEKDDNKLIQNKIYYQFEDKYNQNVRVIDINNICKELCQGTHLKFTNNIKGFKIIKYKKISQNTYRIYAITGDALLEFNYNNYELIKNIKNILKCEDNNIIERINNLINKIKKIKKNNKKLKQK